VLVDVLPVNSKHTPAHYLKPHSWDFQ